MTSPLADKQLVLATDLDGTFLGGSDDARRDFYAWIEANRDRVGLIFVTGRDPAFITSLTRDKGVPRPAYVVGDVGTTIAQVAADHTLTPIPALEEEIADAWDDAGARVRAALSGAPGLTLQPTDFRYRVSYDLDADRFDPSVRDRMHALGFDTLVSDNRYFDVLPRGISKGPSLRRLLDYLGVPHARALAAGDTLNDLSMLTAGLPAVAVGNAEPALRRALDGHDHVYQARAHGVEGIAEAIGALRMLDMHEVL